MSLTIAALLLLPLPLIEGLGARAFRHREAAHEALRRLGRLALPHLERAAGSHRDPEVRRRCLGLLSPFEGEVIEREIARLPCPPLWTGWEAGDHLQRFYEQAMQEAGYEDEYGRWWQVSDVEVRRLATRHWLRSQLLQRRPRAEILRTLEAMERSASAPK